MKLISGFPRHRRLPYAKAEAPEGVQAERHSSLLSRPNKTLTYDSVLDKETDAGNMGSCAMRIAGEL